MQRRGETAAGGSLATPFVFRNTSNHDGRAAGMDNQLTCHAIWAEIWPIKEFAAVRFHGYRGFCSWRLR